MKRKAHILFIRLIQILTISGLSFLINYIVVVLSHLYFCTDIYGFGHIFG